MKEREFEILKMFLERKTLTLEELVDYFMVSERTIRYSIEDINMFLNEKNIEGIKNGKIGFYFEYSNYEKINKLLMDNAPMSVEDIIEYLILKILFFNGINLTKECEILDISRSSIKLYLKLIKEELEEYDLELRVTKEGLLLSGEEENVRRKGLRHIVKILNRDTFLPGITKNFFEAVLKEIEIKKIKAFIEKTQIELEKIMAETSYRAILASMIITVVRVNKGLILRRELEEKDFLFKSYEYRVVKNNIEFFGFLLTEYELYHLTDYFIGSYCCDSDKSIYKNWITLEVKTKKFIDKVGKELKVEIYKDEILIEWLVKDLKSIIYSINRNIKIQKIKLDGIIQELKEIKKIVSDKVWIFNELLIREMREIEIERISYHIQASIKRSKNRNRKRKKVLFVSEFGYGYTKLMAERLMEEVDIKIVEICPKYRINAYKNLDVDVVITNINLDINLEMPIIKISSNLTEEDFNRLEKAGIERRKKKIYLSEILSALSGAMTLETQEDIKKNLKKNMGYDLIDDTDQYDISFDNILKKENILLNEKIIEWKKVIKKGMEILIKNGSVNHDYEKKLLYSVERYGSYLTIYSNVCFAYSKDKSEVRKSDVVFIELEKSINFPGNESINKVFVVSAINEREYLIIAENILDILTEGRLEDIINKKIK
ncbi:MULTISPECIES: BglG family transcription antiterminator [Fusobacterium]|jgi:mannitol operon transcriptional antiterminator|uniref:BglG family transcription antiterminator n=1 Tax=Fusobacterium TaxID=848 RepID=UPI000E9583ED|nr:MULTISPECIES: helix-turn-helix domain-containing protein [Fusobacterium]HBJ79850.1 hypothetical protein [Fusobacterium sp.]